MTNSLLLQNLHIYRALLVKCSLLEASRVGRISLFYVYVRKFDVGRVAFLPCHLGSNCSGILELSTICSEADRLVCAHVRKFSSCGISARWPARLSRSYKRHGNSYCKNKHLAIFLGCLIRRVSSATI